MVVSATCREDVRGSVPVSNQSQSIDRYIDNFSDKSAAKAVRRVSVPGGTPSGGRSRVEEDEVKVYSGLLVVC